jgi:hypothetical protein
MVRRILPTLLACLSTLTVGCQNRYAPATARIETTVFEIPTQYLREYTLGKETYEFRDSSYALSILRPEELRSMLTRRDANAIVLYYRERVVDRWPRVTDNWAYTKPRYGAVMSSTTTGGGAGFIGVRERDGQLEIRIDHLVRHRGVLAERIIESELFYEHFYPAGHVLVFHAPAGLLGQKPSHHVVAFGAVRTDVAPRLGPLSPKRTQSSTWPHP